VGANSAPSDLLARFKGVDKKKGRGGKGRRGRRENN